MRSVDEHGGGNGAGRSLAGKIRNAGFQKAGRSRHWPLDPTVNAPAPYDKADVAAIKAMAEGRAQPFQQTLVLDWLLQITGAYENPWRPGVNGERDSSFAAGKAFIGQQIVKLINLPALDAEQGEQG